MSAKRTDDQGADVSNGPGKNQESDASKKHVERIVLQYLQSKGYTSAEQALREDARLDSDNEISLEDLANVFPSDEIGTDINVPSWILMYNQAEQGNPDIYSQSYGNLRRWIDTSLDMYKSELFATSYPLFVHSFLDLMERDLCEKGKRFYHYIIHTSSENLNIRI